MSKAIPDLSQCDIQGCESQELIRTMVHMVWACLCRTHLNRLGKYLAQLQEHQDHLVNAAAYKQVMSGFPQVSGLSNAEEVISNFLSTENRMRTIIENWLHDPDYAERIFNDG